MLQMYTPLPFLGKLSQALYFFLIFDKKGTGFHFSSEESLGET